LSAVTLTPPVFIALGQVLDFEFVETLEDFYLKGREETVPDARLVDDGEGRQPSATYGVLCGRDVVFGPAGK
jgi:hypothetical protein